MHTDHPSGCPPGSEDLTAVILVTAAVTALSVGAYYRYIMKRMAETNIKREKQLNEKLQAVLTKRSGQIHTEAQDHNNRNGTYPEPGDSFDWEKHFFCDEIDCVGHCLRGGGRTPRRGHPGMHGSDGDAWSSGKYHCRRPAVDQYVACSCDIPLPDFVQKLEEAKTDFSLIELEMRYTR